MWCVFLGDASVPDNGLVLYCGTIMTDEGKEKKVNIDFEPFKPINTSLYLCDNKFHTEALSALLADDHTFGFIVMDGNGSLFGTLSGNAREVLHKFTVDLPKKHGRGGQSALRFARLRLEKRHNYVRKVAEEAVRLFITNDKCNVAGLILAGSADFKTELSISDLFDPVRGFGSPFSRRLISTRGYFCSHFFPISACKLKSLKLWIFPTAAKTASTRPSNSPVCLGRAVLFP
jgi:peptide chain release factor 1